jgi:hypothetical protein
VTAQSSSNKSWPKEEGSGKNGTHTRHEQATNHSTGQRNSLDSSFWNTKMPTYKRSYNEREGGGKEGEWYCENKRFIPFLFQFNYSVT